MFTMEDLWSPIRLTLALASITTVLLLVVGTPIAWWLARSKARWKEAVATVLSLPLVLPPTVLGFYLLLALGPNGPGGWVAGFFGLRTLAFTFEALVNWLRAVFDALRCAADPQCFRGVWGSAT
jgi:molybdate transport system permease protein